MTRYTVVRKPCWDYSPRPWKVVDTTTGEIVSHEVYVFCAKYVRWLLERGLHAVLSGPHGERIVR